MTQNIELRAVGASKAAVRNQVEPRVSGAGRSHDLSVDAIGKPDSVRLTGEAIRLHQSNQSPSTNSKDALRVEQIRLAVADGRYPVDVQSTARRLTRLEMELAGA